MLPEFNNFSLRPCVSLQSDPEPSFAEFPELALYMIPQVISQWRLFQGFMRVTRSSKCLQEGDSPHKCGNEWDSY